jgi:hypothetical protein
VVTAIVGGVILALCLALVVAVARDRGPSPGETAVAYELAWDRLDFDALWTLSARELRDGRDRHGFVAAKRAAYEQQRSLSRLAEHVAIEDAAVTSAGDVALVTTRVELHDGSTVHNVVQLVRRNGRWQVAAYRLAPTTP